MQETIDFTTAGYETLLERLKTAASFVTYEELLDTPREEPCIAWRHDVDFSLPQALVLARIDADKDIPAYFFVNPASQNYNSISPVDRPYIEEIIQLQQTLGLHYDLNPMLRHSRIVIENDIKRQRDLLESHFRVAVSHICFHNPPENVQQKFNQSHLCGMLNTNAPPFYDDILYCSDACSVWKPSSPLKCIQISFRARLQAVTHPLWWSPMPGRPSDRVSAFWKERSSLCSDHTFSLWKGADTSRKG